jgi:hypothetical protein
MICSYTKFHMCSSSGPLLSTWNQKVNIEFMQPQCYFLTLSKKKNILTKVSRSSKVYYHTSFQYTKLSVASVAFTPQIRVATMSLLISGSYKLLGWGVFQWHDIHTNFPWELTTSFLLRTKCKLIILIQRLILSYVLWMEIGHKNQN